MCPEAEAKETLRFEGNKIKCFPRDQSLSDLLCSPRRKTFRVQIYEINLARGQHSRVTVHC